MSDIVALVEGFRRLRVLVIGDAMLDSYLEGSAARLCREGPVPVVRRTAEEHVPGGAANTAANLRALGAEVLFAGVVGPDAPGALLRSSLRSCGVDDAWLVEDDEVATLHKQRILADGQYVVRYDCGDTRGCSPQGQARLAAAVEGAFAQCDLVVISDYGYGAVSDDLLRRLRLLRRGRDCPLAVDAKDLRRFCECAATVITPNQLEVRLAVEPASADDRPLARAEIERQGRRLLDLVDSEHAMITLAADGVLLLSRAGNPLHLAAHPVAHPNDVGAGDSFIAAASLALAAGGTAEEAARVGVEAGGIAVTKRRTAVVQQGELLQRVSLTEQAAPAELEPLVARLAVERARGRTVVFANGVFDILHAGHVHFLRRARALGDILVVGVNSDASARRLQGRNRPFNSERDRAALVAALDPVDAVVVFDEATPAQLIRALLPDIHVKGGDYAGQAIPEADAVREAGGRVMILPLVENEGSDLVIERIVALALEGKIGAAR